MGVFMSIFPPSQYCQCSIRASEQNPVASELTASRHPDMPIGSASDVFLHSQSMSILIPRIRDLAGFKITVITATAGSGGKTDYGKK